LLSTRFRLACKRLGYDAEMRYSRLDTTRFRPPPRHGQLSLF